MLSRACLLVLAADVQLPPHAGADELRAFNIFTPRRVGRPLVTLTTSPSGAGATHFELAVGGAFTSGTPFNVRFRVIDNVQNPTSILMSDCVTVVVK